MERNILVFVYGTLKRGYGNFERLLTEAEFVGEAVSVEANYAMQRIGFPILWQDGDPEVERLAPRDGFRGKVVGEVFRVSELERHRCDRLEGHPRMYKREEREFIVKQPGGPATMTTKAWVYLWQGPSYGEQIVPDEDGQLIWTYVPPELDDDDDDDLEE